MGVGALVANFAFFNLTHIERENSTEGLTPWDWLVGIIYMESLWVVVVVVDGCEGA